MVNVIPSHLFPRLECNDPEEVGHEPNCSMGGDFGQLEGSCYLDTLSRSEDEGKDMVLFSGYFSHFIAVLKEHRASEER